MLAFVEDVLRSAEQAIITFIRRHYIGLTVIFILALFAFGVSAFTYTIAGDEWGGLLVPDYQDGVFIQIGRWLQPPIRHFLGDATPAAAFSMLGLLCLQILSAAVIADMMKLKTRMAFFVLAAVAIFHPFWLEFVVFKYLQIPVGVGLVMATLY
ncbi:MAG: glucosyltransferase domain-containing protein, partial [Chloroflexota bacterium]